MIAFYAVGVSLLCLPWPLALVVANGVVAFFVGAVWMGLAIIWVAALLDIQKSRHHYERAVW